MPIAPKYRLDEQRPEGPRQFTDREEFIDLFEQAVSELPSKEYEVLVYYGVGGIGKTSLRIELCRLLEDKHWPMFPYRPMWAVLDFRNTTYRDVETALFSLRQELNRKYVVQFPSFDLANAIFWQKSHPQSPFRQDPTQLEALLEEGTLFANLVSIVGEVPIVSLVPKLSKVISKTDRLFREWWTKRGHQELNDLQGMEPAKIAEWLPAFWAADLKDYLEREGRPAVLFMDTYEALWEGEGKRTEGRFFTQDAFVRELVSNLPEVLWVITGREKLRWEEEDEDWRKYQRQYPVGGLAEKDARSFLASCGITEEALQKFIVEGSRGVPFYLDLSVDTYLQIKATQERDPSPSDFAGTPQDALDRFLYYLDRSETETLKVLSVGRFWDRELFESLVEEFNTGYPATALPELRRFSFVQVEQIPGTWTIHPLMREALQEDLDAELRGRVHQYLFDHYNDSLEGLESTAISVLHRTALTEAFHHGKHALDTEELFDWFTTIYDVFSRAALWQFLIPLYEEFASLIEDRLGPEHLNTATVLNNLALLYYAQGRYEEAPPLVKRALKIREKVLGEEHPDTSESLGTQATLLYAQGEYAEARQYQERALAICEKVLGEDHPNTASNLSSMAALLYAQGKYAEAHLLYERAQAIFDKVLGEEQLETAINLNNLGMLLQRREEYKEARPYQERALAIWRKVLGEEHPYTAVGLNNLGTLLQGEGEYAEARPYLERALAIREKVLGEEHPDTAHGLNNLGMLLKDQGEYVKARPYLERALAICEKVLGEDRPYTAHSLNNMGMLLKDQGEYAEARPYLERALAIREKVLGKEHPDTAHSLNNLGTLLQGEGEYAEARPYLERALAIREKVLGEKHHLTELVRQNLAILKD
jgi:tetratricopeptide (TPR) repeat protein